MGASGGRALQRRLFGHRSRRRFSAVRSLSLRARGGRVRAREGGVRDRLRGPPSAGLASNPDSGAGQRVGAAEGGGIFCLGTKSIVLTSHTASSNTTKRPSS